MGTVAKRLSRSISRHASPKCACFIRLRDFAPLPLGQNFISYFTHFLERLPPAPMALDGCDDRIRLRRDRNRASERGPATGASTRPAASARREILRLHLVSFLLELGRLFERRGGTLRAETTNRHCVDGQALAFGRAPTIGPVAPFGRGRGNPNRFDARRVRGGSWRGLRPSFLGEPSRGRYDEAALAAGDRSRISLRPGDDPRGVGARRDGPSQRGQRGRSWVVAVPPREDAKKLLESVDRALARRRRGL